MMTDYLAAPSPAISSSSTTNSQKQQLNRVVAPSKGQNNHLAASSSSLQMNRTGSAGAPSLPESPAARNRLAATGFSPSPLAGQKVGGSGIPPRSPRPLIQVHSPEGSLALARLKNTAIGLSPSPLVRRGFTSSPNPFVRVHTPEIIHSPWANANGEAASSVDLLDDEGSESLLASHSLLGTRFDIGSYSTTNLDERSPGLSATNSSINLGRQTFADGKRERIVIQVGEKKHKVWQSCI